MYENTHVDSVLMEITNACNLNCQHCYNAYDRTHSSAVFLPLSKIEYVIKSCEEYGLHEFYLSGGEPLCHPEIMGIIDMCKKYPNIRFTITTNGLLFSKELINAIEGSSNIVVQISVDGLTKETYEQQRGKNTFSVFQKVLNQLIASKIQYLSARTCITRKNYKEVPFIYEYLINHRIMPSFIFVNQMGNASDNWESLSLNMSMKLRVLSDINTLNKKYDQKIAPPEPGSACNFTNDYEFRSLMVKYDGNVAPCQFFYSDSIGNFFEMSVPEILCYENLKKYYELGHQRKAIMDNRPECKRCKIHAICSYGCLGMANDLGTPLGTDGACDYRILTSAMYSNGLICFDPLNRREELV